MSQLSYIALVINDYVIAGADVDHLIAVFGNPLVEWPEVLSDAEKRIPWCQLLVKIDDPSSAFLPGLDRQGWSLAFSRFTPDKLRENAA